MDSTFTGAKCAQLPIGMSQAEGCLPGINASSEQFKLELRLEIAKSCGCGSLHAKPSLPHAEIYLSIWCKFAWERWQLGGSHNIEPVRVVGLEIVARVQHDKAVQVNVALRRGIFWSFLSGAWLGY